MAGIKQDKCINSHANTLLVAAIDFGTTFSGYAFSFRHEYESNRMNIWANTSWIASGGGLVSWKTPTTVLLNQEQTFDSFGYEAENNYIDLVNEESEEGWYYFKRFKMLLHNKQNLGRETTIQDLNGKELKAMTVFTHAIKYLKDHLMDSINKKDLAITEDDITFVLTIPAIWNEPAKQFMREAAVDAGIPSKRLVLALEPEAASLFCRHVPVEKIDTGVPGETTIIPFQNGITYMVLDLGGGTVDVTVHKVINEESVCEIFKASGGAWGGTKVDEAFYRVFTDIFEENTMNSFREEFRNDFLDMERQFELKKRTVKKGNDAKTVQVNIPPSFFNVYEELHEGVSKDAALKCSKYCDKISIKHGRTKFDPDLFRGIFDHSISSIIQHVHDILNNPKVGHVEAILMVGGFSEADIIVQKLREEFADKRVVVPADAGLAVVKGAVLYGHCPTAIASRVCKFTYGIAARGKFKKGIHPESHKTMVNKVPYCNNLFDKFVKIGESVNAGHTIKRTYTIDDVKAGVSIEIIVSDNENPMLTTEEGCRKIGTITVTTSGDEWSVDTKIVVEMGFGGTEFHVSAYDLKNESIKYDSKFDFLIA